MGEIAEGVGMKVYILEERTSYGEWSIISIHSTAKSAEAKFKEMETEYPYTLVITCYEVKE